MTRVIRHAEARALQGHRAGFASRVVADLVDLGVAWLLGLSVLAAAGVASYLLTGPPFRLPVLPNWLDAGAGAAIAVAYLALTWAATGRSVGKQPAGLRVVDRGGGRLALWRSFIRAVLYDWAYHPAEEPVAADDGHSPRPARSSKHA